MPLEPVSSCCLVVAGGSGAYAIDYVRRLLQGNGEPMKEEEKMKVAESLRSKGWTCHASPSFKFLEDLPQTEASVMGILKDPVFKQNEHLLAWMKQQLEQALKLKAGNASVLKQETVQPVLESEAGTFVMIMARLAVHAFSREELVDSPFLSSDPDGVMERLKALGSSYHELAGLLRSDGVDGDFLANNEISREVLSEDYKISRRLQQDVLLNHFRQYKPRKIMAPYVAIGVIAYATSYNHTSSMFGSGVGEVSHEQLKISAQKLISYEAGKFLMDEKESPEACSDQNSAITWKS